MIRKGSQPGTLAQRGLDRGGVGGCQQTAEPGQGRAWAGRSLGRAHHANAGQGAAWPKRCPQAPMLYLLGRRVGGARQEVTQLVWGPPRAEGAGERHRGDKRRERHRHGLSKQLRHTQTLCEEPVSQETISGDHYHPTPPHCFQCLPHSVNKNVPSSDGPSKMSQALRPFVPCPWVF